MTDYLHDYQTLGLQPGCTVAALNAARRRLVKSWHPDRFPSGSAMKRQADERIKDINTAFDRLTEYHKNFGVLPNPGASADRGPSIIVVDPAPAAPRGTSPHANRPEAAAATPRRYRHPWRRRALHWAIALAAVALLAEIVRTGWLETQGPTPTAYQPPPPPAELRTVASAESSAPNHDRYFTIGSSLGEVYAIQGVPSATENGVWHYGKSKVYFAEGIVTSWEHDSADPLKATAVPDASTPKSFTFTIGSSKAEVRAVQGTPFIETDTLWDYGLSKVYFQDDHVTGWDSSLMHPLKARK